MEVGTGIMIQPVIESIRGVMMRDLDFTCRFYVYTNRKVDIHKSKMVHIQREDGDMYIAQVNTAELGAGQLMCEVRINDPEPKWGTTGMRPVILKRDTHFTIGDLRCNPYWRCRSTDEFDSGYRVSFNEVFVIPKADVAYIFYGHLVNQITSYTDITSDMLVSPENHIVSVSAGKMGKTSCGVMNEGDKVVVLIPTDTNYVATKDNGFGGQMAFSEVILGANGNETVNIDGVTYRVYGEMMTTEGEMFVYVN